MAGLASRLANSLTAAVVLVLLAVAFVAGAAAIALLSKSTFQLQAPTLVQE
jgi:hypothetical protein